MTSLKTAAASAREEPVRPWPSMPEKAARDEGVWLPSPWSRTSWCV